MSESVQFAELPAFGVSRCTGKSYRGRATVTGWFALLRASVQKSESESDGDSDVDSELQVFKFARPSKTP